MEIVIPAVPSAAMDFEFNSARSSPYLSAPASPKRFGEYFFPSAPTSPSGVSRFYGEFDRLYMMNEEHSSAIPFDWEEKPGTPKSQPPSGRATATADNEDDFAFNFSEEMEKESLTAEELFDGGKIRSLKPPPRLQLDEDYTTQKSPLLSPRSPRSPISEGKRIIREVFSPRSKKHRDPFAAAVESTRKQTQNERGRERRAPDLSKSSSRRATRSLSPFRVSAYPWEEEEKQQQQPTKQPPFSSKPSSSSKSSSRKWRLRDFFLFRSASEGHSTDKEPKYGALFKKYEDIKNSSFRSTDGSGESMSGSRRRGQPQVSAHELHYTKNKAASENLKKRTFLPYKQGILGRLAINPLAHGFRS